MKNHLALFVSVLVLLGIGCSAKPCGDFAKQVCAKAPDTAACEKASQLTNNDECRGLLKELDRYIELANQEVTEPGAQPPAEEAAAEEPAKEEAPAEEPAKEEAAAEEPAQEEAAAEEPPAE